MNRNYYVIRASNGTTVRCLRGSASPKITGGGGGWDIVDRPRRVGLTIWKGREPYQMSVSVLFDGGSLGLSVENAIATLNQMQMGDDLQEPPTLTIDGALPVKGARWVIGSPIEWGDQVIWSADGDDFFRIRQDATISLIQYKPEDFVEVKKQGKTRPNTVTTKDGDTLRSIAKTYLGDASKWKDIANAQSPPLRVLGGKELPSRTELRIP